MERPASELPHTVIEAWDNYHDPREIISFRETSPNVSTNSVYRLVLEDGEVIFTKVSSFGSFSQFREDHQRVRACHEAFKGTRYEGWLAGALLKDGDIYTYHSGRAWVIFYHTVRLGDRLPRVLNEAQVRSAAEEIARFHNACVQIRDQVPDTTKNLRSDIHRLLDRLYANRWRGRIMLSDRHRGFLIDQCESFLKNIEMIGYQWMMKIPVMVDWNIGNFSIQETDEDTFQIYSRWDYDWFRIEPPTLDFYFFSRVASSVGDKTIFVYGAETLLEPRFQHFLRCYHAVRPLNETDLRFLKEVYRFFILNYVILDGEHFFRPRICERLQRQSLVQFLPQLTDLDFSVLNRCIER